MRAFMGIVGAVTMVAILIGSAAFVVGLVDSGLTRDAQINSLKTRVERLEVLVGAAIVE